MKRPLLNLFLTFFIAFSAHSQSITSARSNVFDQYTTKYGQPREIKNTNTFYNDSGKEVQEEKVTFSRYLDTISELRYKNSELNARLTFIFDKNQKLIFRSFTNLVPLIGWQSQKAEYRYSNNGLNEIIDYDSNNNISGKAIFENDSLGNPVSMKLYDHNDILLGYETAEYDYSNNTYTYKVYDSNDTLKTTKNYRISSKKSDVSKYNEFGDVIFYPRNWNQNDHVSYLVEYKYDKLGNWIDQKIFKVEKQGNEWVNKKKDRRFKRKIKYW